MSKGRTEQNREAARQLLKDSLWRLTSGWEWAQSPEGKSFWEEIAVQLRKGIETLTPPRCPHCDQEYRDDG